MTVDKQLHLQRIWEFYKGSYTLEQKEARLNEFEKQMTAWSIYRDQLLQDTFTIDDYTNRRRTRNYLCNYLERDSSYIFGSAKPGNAINFGIKLNADGTYTIGKNNPQESRENAITFFQANITPLLKGIVTATSIEEQAKLIEKNTLIGAKQILRKMAVLQRPHDLLYIYSHDTINALYDEFIGGEETHNLLKNKAIVEFIKETLDIEPESKLDSMLISYFLWRYANSTAIADENAPNVILYGPPGTGKTYSIKQNLDFVCQGDRSRYEFIQFHPSFTYEDFIEGIKPKGITANGNIKFELVNGVFKKFCIKAKNNPEQNYYFVVDEINRANLSSVFGETLLLLEKDYRHQVGSLDNLFKTQYSSLIEELDEATKANLAYELIDGEAYFGVPQNVIFIGMMNDVDKSIDTFDLALRRRFKWIKKGFNADVIRYQVKYRNGANFHNIDDYVNACIALNKFISHTLGMGSSYEFGHAFFMKISQLSAQRTIKKGALATLFNLYLRPTLKEYLRSMYAESDLESKLDQAKKVFVEKV